MATATAQKMFYSLWQEEGCREKLFELLPKTDICSVRLVNSACCNLVTKRLFIRTHISFTASTFTKPCRIQALSRIGHHIEHLSFSLAHSDATFLPPLIHPADGHEISFLYTPHTSMASVLARPKYGTSELGELLTQQYPPLFHAATNVPSFIHALRNVPNLRHLSIKTPGQDPSERYRRDIVDYALLSLRISVERVPLLKLTKLSLSGVHPAAFVYLRPGAGGFGCLPSGPRRWAQIRKLHISVDSWDFYGPSPGLDQLKIIEDYIRSFAGSVEKLNFSWLGRRGPCPLALAGDPLFAPPRCTQKLFNEVTSPMSPLPAAPRRPPIHLPRLRYLQVRNATMSAPQLRGLIKSHRATVREFDFDNVALVSIRSSTSTSSESGSSGADRWEQALAPLKHRKSDASAVWSQTTLVGTDSRSGKEFDTASCGTGDTVRSGEDRDLSVPSAAAAAASKELLEMDLEGFAFGDEDTADVDGVEAWRQRVGAATEDKDAAAISPGGGEDDDCLDPDIAAARDASQAFSTKLKKRRLHKGGKKHHSKTKDKHHRAAPSEPEDDNDRRNRHHRNRSRHKHSYSDETSERSRSRRHHRRHKRHHSEEIPPMPTTAAMPEVIGTDDEGFCRPVTPRPLDISAPILNTEPLPILQPTVYDPATAMLRSCTRNSSGGISNEGLSSVQLEIERELELQAEAEAAAAHTSALRRARDAVLSKLSREFCRRGGGSSKESAAVSSVAAGNFPICSANGSSCAAEVTAPAPGSSLLGIARFREGFHLFGKSSVSVAPDSHSHKSLESQTALVPLIFSRS